MKLKALISVAAFTLAFSSFSAMANQTATTNNMQNTQTTATQTQMNGAIVKLLITLNQNEINAAKLALKKTNNPMVVQFAKMMIQGHTQNLNQTLKLAKTLKITPKTTDVSMQMKTNGQLELRQLAKLNGGEFDRAYINAMVQGHEKALQLVNELTTKTTNTTLQAHLEATKMAVQHHLEMAKADQTKLASN